MAKMTLVRATHDQWQWVMLYLTNFAMPETLGSKEYKAIERARIQEEIAVVVDELTVHSHFMKLHGQEYRPLFGAKEDWTADPETPKEFKAVHPEKIYEISLSTRAVSGLVWLFTVLLTPPERKKGADGKETPTHPYMVQPALAARFIWPITRAMGKVTAVKRSVGLEEAPLKVWEEDEVEVAR